MTLITRKSALCKCENKGLTGNWAKKGAYTWVLENLDQSKSKSHAIHILSFFNKMGFFIYLGALQKGAIRQAHPYYIIWYLRLNPLRF